jgi:threonine dehydrogenase-like Zn-dependent dehydrogenase
MAEFAYNPVQLVEAGQNVILDTVIPCNKGYVYHRDQSGIVILRGIVNNPSGCFARYQVTFNGNIALPEGGTAGPISIALAIDGEPVQTSRAIVTPAAAEEYFNVTSTAIITVPKGCCFSVAVENASSPATVGGASPAINVQNANMTVSRIA